MSFQKVKYKLINNDTGAVLGVNAKGKFVGIANDPKNWDESEKTLKRSTKTFGIVTELSKNLEFVKDGAEFLNSAYNFKDIEADVTLEEWRVHPNTEAWYLHSTGLFDFSEYKENKLSVKVPFKTGGLNALIKAQGKEKFELERLESINGKVIDALLLKTVALTSRDILLIGKVKSNNSSSVFTQTANTYSRLPSLTIESEVTGIENTIVADDLFTFASIYNNPTHFFYLKSDVAKTVTVRADYDISVQAAGASTYRFKLYLYRYSFDGTNYNFEQLYDLVNPTNAFTPETQYSGQIDQDVILAADDSILFVVEIITNTSTSGQSIQYFYGFENILSSPTNDLRITVTENSQREDSNTQAALFHDIGEKTMQIITGEKLRYYSEFYGRIDLGYSKDGTFALTGATLGLWIRQFFEKKIEWSLDGFLKTSNAIHDTGYTTEIINNKETLVHEDLKYFFQEQTVIKLPNQVSDVKREVAKDFYHSSLEFGYKKPSGDNLYEEAQGLDEYNTKNGFVNNITRVDKKYTKISDARADAYAKEFARRKPKLTFPAEDTRYDKDIHLLDLKKGLGLALEERTWQDDYEVAPKNVFSPNTATNLRLTPFRISERHQWFYGSGLLKHQQEKVRFSNGIGNTELITKKVGEVERAENGDLLVSELKKPKFVNQWITFQHEVDFFVNEQIYGKTEVNGRMIPNYFFKVEFINEFGLKEYGYLFEVKPNKEGKFKLLKAI